MPILHSRGRVRAFQHALSQTVRLVQEPEAAEETNVH
jgi:hypothetical protein